MANINLHQATHHKEINRVAQAKTTIQGQCHNQVDLKLQDKHPLVFKQVGTNISINR